MSDTPIYPDDDDIEISPEAFEILRQHVEDDSEPEEESEEDAEETEGLSEDEREEIDEQLQESDEQQYELSDDAEYYNSYATEEEAFAFAEQFSGVFVVVYNEDKEQYDVYRDYGNEAAA